MEYNLSYRILPDMGFAQRNRELQGLSFQNTFSQNYIQNFMKTLENYILGPFWALFAYFRTSTNFPKKTHFCHFFLFLDFYHCAKIFINVMNRIWEKLVTDMQRDVQTSMNSRDLPCQGAKNSDVTLIFKWCSITMALR